jgi:hypothetical protein
MPYIGNPISDFNVSTAMLNTDSVTSIKIDDGTIVNADINDSAAIAMSKLALSITNSEINASAAIAGTKISPDFGSQNIATTGNVSIGGTNLNMATAYIDFSGSISTPSTAAAIYRPADNQLAFSTANSERVKISNSGLDVTGAITGTGNVTITKASPVLRLADTTDPQGVDGVIGKIEFFGNDGSSGGVDVRSFIQTISTNAAGNAHALTIGLGESNNAPGEKVRILGDGKVGIGTSSPDAKLEVVSPNSTYAFKLTCSENVSGSYNGLSIAGNDENSGSYPLVVVSNSTTHETGGHPILCCTSRKVGIGTLSPTRKLQITEETANRVVNITTGGSSGAFVAFLDSNTTDDSKCRVGTKGGNDLSLRGDSHSFQDGAGSDKVHIDSSGRLLLGTTTQNNNAALQVTTAQQVVASFEGTGVSDPQIYLGDDMSSPTNNALIFGYDKADNRGYLTIAGDADNTLTISDGNLVGINTTANVEHFNVAGNMRFVNPTGTTRRIIALPSGGYTVGSSGGSAIAFHRISDGGGGSDEIAFETHYQGNRHAESARISKFGGITFNGDTAAANALDDYEEGTFTPTQPTIGTNSASGHYTKIGRYVYASIFMTLPTNSSGVAFYIDDLPFTSLNNSGTNINGGYSIYSTYGNPFTVRVHDNATRAQVSAIGGGNINLSGLDNLNFRIQVHYMTN